MNSHTTESLEEFYKRKFDWIPNSIRKEIGHFNVFRLESIVGKPLPYKRRDFYKVMLVKGKSRVHYADRVIEIKKQALSFSNPRIPYRWEHVDNNLSGYFCIFNEHFFHHFGDLNQYSVFQPQGEHIFELSDEDIPPIVDIYEQMFDEINSDYIHKYDVLRNLVFQILHTALKMRPSSRVQTRSISGSQRVSSLFLELLTRQYPIEENHPRVRLRTASDFARQLNVHVNHLNRTVKETTGKTTTQIISERLIQEAKVLLKHSSWNISEISYALGFNEATHFSNFFKKYLDTSPSQFRKG